MSASRAARERAIKAAAAQVCRADNPFTRRARLPEREAGFQGAVVDLAHFFGWRVAHFRTAQRADGGYLTAVGADGAGWPDLVLVRERVVFAEIKAARGRLSAAQIEWLDRLRAAEAEAYVWRPVDWEAIRVILAPAA